MKHENLLIYFRGRGAAPTRLITQPKAPFRMSYFRNHKLSATTNKKEKSSMKIVIIPGKPTGVELGGIKLCLEKRGKS